MPGHCRRTVYWLEWRDTLHLNPACPRAGVSGEQTSKLLMAQLEELSPDRRNWCGRCSHRQ